MATITQDHAFSHDPEKQANPATPPDSHAQDDHYDPLKDDPLKHHHLKNLRIFQDLVGIRTQPHIGRPELSLAEATTLRHNTTNAEGDHAPGGRPRHEIRRLLFNRAPENGGYYQRAMDEQLTARIGFLLSSACINLIYIVQILTAATITGLASLDHHKTVLTVLGALNTVLAGLMAYLKGQGLPNRLLRSRDQFGKVLEYAEYKERQFSRQVDMPPNLRDSMNPYKEADNVRDLYMAAKKDQQENYPDTYLNNNEREALTNLAVQDRDGVRKEGEAQALLKGQTSIVVSGPAAD
jgi:hypothetical protein